jgi:hypothetical protein
MHPISAAAALADDRVVHEPVTRETPLFEASPSQLINLPSVLYGLAVMALIGAIDGYASGYLVIEKFVLALQAAGVLAGVLTPFCKTAFTRITIDHEQIAWSQGVFRRRVSYLKLASIDGLSCVKPRWQQPFNVGFIMISTTDKRHPARRLPGIYHCEQLAERLEKAVIAAKQQAATGRASLQ